MTDDNTILRSFELENQVALVTGSCGYLGQKMVEALCEAGAHVILNGRNEEKLYAQYTLLKSKKFNVSYCVADITDFEQTREQLFPLLTKHSKLDILVNNAYSGRPSTLKNSMLKEFSQAYHVSVEASYNLIDLCLPFLKEATLNLTKSASVINIGSMYGIVSPNPEIYGDSGMNNPPFYGAAKAGLIQLSKYLACHLAPFNIRVNSLSPGPFPPKEVNTNNPEFYRSLCNKVPLKRIGKAEEIKGPLLFLASNASSYVTGTNLIVDGGWTAW